MRDVSKLFLLIAALVALAACRPHVSETPPAPEFDNAVLFDKKGCLKADVAAAHAEDMPCLDKNYDGCITRKNWEAFMDIWKTKTPVPGIPLCEQI